ncbi:MAG TPA: hypothetical protein VGB53_09585 [Rubricoccaceae bacterium]|jgi:hypothetical protein
MNALLPSLQSALLLLFLIAVPSYAASRVSDASSRVDDSQAASESVMQAGLPLDRDAPVFDIEAFPATGNMAFEPSPPADDVEGDVAFEIIADVEVVVTAPHLPA